MQGISLLANEACTCFGMEDFGLPALLQREQSCPELCPWRGWEHVRDGEHGEPGGCDRGVAMAASVPGALPPSAKDFWGTTSSVRSVAASPVPLSPGS